MTPQFVDISAFQPQNIDWQAYRAWSAQWDGIARVAMKATEGVGFTDPHFAAYRAGALAAGVDQIFYYHFARPDLANTATDEANWCHSVVGAIRDNDQIILDIEVQALATEAWAHVWLFQQEQNYEGKLPGIYASPSYVESNLQYPPLNRYPLWLANWQFTPNVRPPAPLPWTSYEALQYTDKATNIPGIGGNVDCSVFLAPTLAGGTDMPLSLTDPFAREYFTGDDTRWNCSNGCSIFGGILAYYREIGGSPRLPVTNEINDIPGVAYQIYEAGIIVWDPQNKLGKPAGAGDCYMVMLSSDLGKQCTGLAVAEGKIMALQAQLQSDGARSDMQTIAGIADKYKA